MESITATGGRDTPEDWVRGYKLISDNITMNWRQKSFKIIIHIADAGVHSKSFSDGEGGNYESQEMPLVNLIKQCAYKNISKFGYQIGSHPQLSFPECKKIYDSVKSKDCYYEVYHFEHASDEVVASKLKENITNHITAFITKK